jgi:dTDP-4-amino-4,6-dideoxygalactose transaminase
MPEAPGNRSTFWLTSLTIYPSLVGIDLEQVLQHLETLDIESRPVWKPMHLPPVFSDCEVSGGAVLEHLFQNGLCILSGSSLTDSQRDQVVGANQGSLRKKLRCA